MKYGYNLFFLWLVTGLLFLAWTTPASAVAIIDQTGRKVHVPNDPQRVIALAPNITEIVFALKQERRLVGVTRYSDFPQEAATLPKVGSYVHLDLEKIVALKPDLCIAIKDGNPKVIVQKMTSLNIPVYAVNPMSLDTMIKTVREIGKLLDAKQHATHLVHSMRIRINRVKQRVQQTAFRPGVFFQIGISPIVSVGTPTFIHELIVLAGGTNLAAGPVPYPRFNKEQVLALAPEIIIITSMARAVVFEQVRAEWNQWPHLPAVKNQRIFLEDSNLFDRPTPRLVDGLELLARLIHPEIFGDMH
ncbi:MAG: cobalamin-binding protein [Desulfobacterales bacterium]|nr:MAG: cobalamin-binding protein [Desulfobacterales bacterium]